MFKHKAMSNKEIILTQTIAQLGQMSEQRLQQVSDYAAYLKSIDEKDDAHELMSIATNGGSFNFLEKEPDIYTDDDLKEKF